MLNVSSGYDSGPEAGAVVALALMSLLYVAFIVFAIYMYMRIARKAGWTLWHGLLVLVPVAGVVFLIMFAFVEWPVERRLREAEARLALANGGTPYGGPADGGGAYGNGAYGSGAYGSGVYGSGAYAGYGAPGTPGASDAYGTPSAYGTPAAPPASGTTSPYELPPTSGPVPPAPPR
ncbi:hypothetical protein [Cellulomonas xiejunii]|uniref:hypothetical protein n=1 Tax=Cellulomonas xiejunii TaxID=2968083 RepID=UPI001D0DCD02|nr:hypothetical protein [Cellulomonas xiejunii]MCC2313812.1 hypothetical protein [Cellulomonas xiejunii]